MKSKMAKKALKEAEERWEVTRRQNEGPSKKRRKITCRLHQTMEVLLRLQNNNASSYGGDEEGSDVISLTKLTAEMEEYDSDVNSLTRC